MECQILFTGKNKKNIINLSFAENAHRVVKVKSLQKYAKLLFLCKALSKKRLSERCRKRSSFSTLTYQVIMFWEELQRMDGHTDGRNVINSTDPLVGDYHIH